MTPPIQMERALPHKDGSSRGGWIPAFTGMTKVVPPSPFTDFTGELQDAHAFMLNDIRLTDNAVFGQPPELAVGDLEQVL